MCVTIKMLLRHLIFSKPALEATLVVAPLEMFEDAKLLRTSLKRDFEISACIQVLMCVCLFVFFTFSEHVWSSSESFRDDQPHSQCSFTDHSGDVGGDRLLSVLPLQNSRRRHQILLTVPAARKPWEETQNKRKGKENDSFSLFA